MVIGDKIGDMIIRLKNAGMVGKKQVEMPHSKLRQAVADKLVAAGYIEKAEQQGKKVQKTLVVTLKYEEDGKHRIEGVKRISKPGRRLYVKVANIHRVKFGKGHILLSTPAGILTNEEAKKQNVGGEQLFMIW